MPSLWDSIVLASFVSLGMSAARAAAIQESSWSVAERFDSQGQISLVSFFFVVVCHGEVSVQLQDCIESVDVLLLGQVFTFSKQDVLCAHITDYSDESLNN